MPNCRTDCLAIRGGVQAGQHRLPASEPRRAQAGNPLTGVAPNAPVKSAAGIGEERLTTNKLWAIGGEAVDRSRIEAIRGSLGLTNKPEIWNQIVVAADGEAQIRKFIIKAAADRAYAILKAARAEAWGSPLRWRRKAIGL